jgi:hypothetical protein
MAELKTKENDGSVEEFLAGVDESRREDCRTLAKLMKEITCQPPKMWGSSIVGFGRYRYRYESGREGEWFQTGFSPRKNDLTIYLRSGFEPSAALMKKLGRHRSGRSCLYVKKLADIDTVVLRELIRDSVRAGAE